MEIIKDENWKYTLSFDNNLYKIVKRYSFKLPTIERNELNFEIDFYRTFFSIEQVLAVLSKLKGASVDKFKSAVDKRKRFILYIPNQLISHYKSIIEAKFLKEKDWLIDLIKYANASGFVVSSGTFCKNILGKKIYAHSAKLVKKYGKREIEKVIKKKVVSGQHKSVALDSVFAIKNNFTLQSLWGKYNVKDFKLTESADDGMGKWIDEKVSYLPNQFILNNNSYTLGEKETLYQTYLNIYPGYAHFYSYVLNPVRTKFFDNGSSFLINGWANFALWHVEPCLYTRNLKHNNSKTLTFMLSKKYNKESINKMFSHLLSYNSKNQAIKLLIEITQYIGSFESKCLGAIATEYLLDKYNKGQKEFLKFLSTQNIGNFFESYLKNIKD